MAVSALCALASGNVVGALLAPRRQNALRSCLALACGIAAQFAALGIPRSWPIARTVLAFVFAGGFLRLIVIVRRPNAYSLAARAFVTAIPVIDPRHITWGKPKLLAVPYLLGGLELALAWGLFMAASRIGPAAPYSSWTSAARTLVGGTSVYLLVDGVGRQGMTTFFVFGAHIDRPHDAPIRSTSVSEFWGRRWNRSIGRWLQENAFRPAAARFGIAAGIMAAFGASAMLHFFPIWIGSNVRNAALMASFFLVHGGVVLLEGKLRITRMRPVVGWTWTMGVFALTAPLFVEPMLEALGS